MSLAAAETLGPLGETGLGWGRRMDAAPHNAQRGVLVDPFRQTLIANGGSQYRAEVVVVCAEQRRSHRFPKYSVTLAKMHESVAMGFSHGRQY